MKTADHFNFPGNCFMVLLYRTNILVERGLNFRYWNMYRRRTYFNCLYTTQKSDFVVIDSKHISIAIGILLAGALGAAIIFCKEYYLGKTKAVEK